MIKIYDKTFAKINNSLFKSKILNYTKENPCCYGYPNCNCPKHQSHAHLHHAIPELRESLYNALDKCKLNCEITHMWSFVTFNNSEVDSINHNHQVSNNKEYTGLLYLTKTDIGTVFDDEVITPKINTWYIWDSKLYHRPNNGITEKNRIVISTGLKELEH